MGNTSYCWHFDAVKYIVNPFHSEFMVGRRGQMYPFNKRPRREHWNFPTYLTHLTPPFVRRLCSRFFPIPKASLKSEGSKKNAPLAALGQNNESESMKLKM